MKLLVCMHHPSENPGVFMEVINDQKMPYETLEFYQNPSARISTDSFTHLIVMGGAMNVDQMEDYPFLRYERVLIRDFIDHHKPILGICLGAQLIARTLGAPVYKNPASEVGWSSIDLKAAASYDPLFALMNQQEMVFQWHGDTFDLPDSCVWLASSPVCPHQAFRYASNVYALQFHLEAGPTMIQDWMKDEPDYRYTLQQTDIFSERANYLSKTFFKKWLER